MNRHCVSILYGHFVFVTKSSCSGASLEIIKDYIRNQDSPRTTSGDFFILVKVSFGFLHVKYMWL